MRRALTLISFLVMPACEAPPDSPPPLADGVGLGQAEADTAGARAAVLQFHEALARGDSAGALALLHPEAVIYEAGHAETVTEYRAGHLAADMEFAAGTEREILQEASSPIGRGVLYVAETQTQGSFRDREIDSLGVETMVLEPSNDQWRIRHIHWSSR